jgi:hypothetical protein
MKTNRFIILCSFYSIIVGCNTADLNTVDPQASPSPGASSKDSLFVSKYKLVSSFDSSFHISEAWLEKSWRYRLDGSRPVKLLTDGIQLDININSERTGFGMAEYLINWQMKEEANGFVARLNNVYVLFLKDRNLPDSFKITVSKINKDRSAADIGSFVLRKL